MRLDTLEYQQLALNAIAQLAKHDDTDSKRALRKIKAAVDAAVGGDGE